MSTQDTSTSRLEQAGFIFYAAGVALIQFSIRAEWFLGIALIIWIILASRDRQRPAAPAFFLPLAVFAAITLVSAALAIDPFDSLQRALRQLSLFLLVPMTMRLAHGSRASRVIDVVIALGAVVALIGVVQWLALGYDEQHRPRGTLSNWMTYSGLLMLVFTAAAARLLFVTRDWIWPAVALPSLLVALVGSYTRNAWIGATVAVGVLLAARRRVLLIALPLFAVVALAIVPDSIRQRATSAFDPSHPSNRDRVAMLKAGVAMIKDHPVLGVGMNMVPRVYLQYRTSDAADSSEATGPETRSHLHNVPMQLAAERGLPALAIWLWFVLVAGRDLWRLVKSGPAPAVAAAGFGALVAMLTAGLFEHNFGDSEFLILFLALISLPFAAAGRTRA